ncbi:hypothetical protein SNEBB_000645 [Seison nebaliae]|nr:hypothetical protein SNEBB_000645 [Seison nebaliae]
MEETSEEQMIIDESSIEFLLDPMKGIKINENELESVQEKLLFISGIYIENFKSYENINFIGPLHPKFSCIVGPNGCGKSNVMDAILFVFGFRASNMRMKKLNELIYRMSDHKSHDFGRVKIIFMNRNSNEHLSIERAISIDGKSKYLLNDVETSRNQIRQKLREHSIDIDEHRFLILQGEIERISQMRPKGNEKKRNGLLEYLEEVLETSHFTELLNDLRKKCEALENDILPRTKRELKNVQFRLDNHRKSRSETIEEINRFNLRNEKSFKNFILIRKLLSRSIEKCREEYEETSKELDKSSKEYEDKLNNYKKSIENHRKEMEKMQKQFVEFSKKLYELDELKDQLTTLKRQKVNEELKKTDNVDELGRTKKKLEKMGNKEEKWKEVKETEKKLRDMVEIIGEMKMKIEKMNEKLNERDGRIRMENEKKNSEKMDLENCVRKLKEIIGKKNSKKLEIDENEKKLNSFQTELEKKEKELNEVEKKIKDDENQIQNDDEDDGDDLVEVCGRLEKLTNEENNLFDSICELQDRLNSQQAEENFLMKTTDKSLQCLLRDGSLYGKLGQLGSIPEKYDIAISTSTSALDNYVVRDSETGQRAIQLLREHRARVAKFIISDSINYLKYQINRKFRCPPNSERLFDVIVPDRTEYRLPFYFAVRDTLVVADLDVARSIQFKSNNQYRIVTLGGKIIESSGAMIGGGKSYMGAMRISGRRLPEMREVNEAKSLDDCRMDLKECEKRLTIIRNDKQKLSEKVGRMKEMAVKRKLNDEKRKELEWKRNQLMDMIEELRNAIIIQKKFLLEQIIPQTMEEENSIGKLRSELTQIKIIEEQFSTVHYPVEYVEIKQELDKKEKIKMEMNLKKNKLERMMEKERIDKISFEREILELTRKSEIISNRIIRLEEFLKSKEEEKNIVESSLKENDRIEEKIEEHQIQHETLSIKLRKLKQSSKVELNRLKETKLEKEYSMNEMEELKEKLKKFSKSFHRLHSELLIDELDIKRSTRSVLSKHSEKDLMKFFQETENLKEFFLNQKKSIIDKSFEMMEIDEEISLTQLNKIGEKTKNEFEKGLRRVRLELENSNYVNRREITRGNILNNFLQHQMLNDDFLNSMEKKMDMIKKFFSIFYDHLRLTHELKLNELIYQKIFHNIQQVESVRIQQFNGKLKILKGYLKSIYSHLSHGGDAELQAIDSIQPFLEGIQYSIRPSGRSWKKMEMLSGGERTLASLALVFAIQRCRPCSFYIMDEIDAALDYRNSQLVSDYILRDGGVLSQFIIISLRPELFEKSLCLFTVYKINNRTLSWFSIPILKDHIVGKLVKMRTMNKLNEPHQNKSSEINQCKMKMAKSLMKYGRDLDKMSQICQNYEEIEWKTETDDVDIVELKKYFEEILNSLSKEQIRELSQFSSSFPHFKNDLLAADKFQKIMFSLLSYIHHKLSCE